MHANVTSHSQVQLKPQTATRRQVGILGGNFNPVHLAHLTAADQVGHALGLDKVYLMPEAIPPHVDQKTTIDAKHRLAMLELAIADNDLLEIEPFEITRGGVNYTYETMQRLIELHPNTDYYFIIGGDMVEYLPKWKEIDRLLQLVHFVGIKRPGYQTTSAYPIIWIDVPLLEISSSMLRKKIKEGCSTNYLLPDAVKKYIEKEGLYLE
ncbi:nicotinate-nucleotide adenylyltransferase [Enterococcus bulliens]